jgi:1,4-dihydroxy-2-naphthoyl-CoA hydrolase
MAHRMGETMDGALGFEITEAGEELARGHFEVTDSVRQPMGIVHGGAYAAMAETLASATTYLHVQPDNIAVGLSNTTSFMRPVTEGTVHAEGRRRHRGRTTWIWDVDFTDAEGRLCASSRVTMAIRPKP